MTCQSKPVIKCPTDDHPDANSPQLSTTYNERNYRNKEKRRWGKQRLSSKEEEKNQVFHWIETHKQTYFGCLTSTFTYDEEE